MGTGRRPSPDRLDLYLDHAISDHDPAFPRQDSIGPVHLILSPLSPAPSIPPVGPGAPPSQLDLSSSSQRPCYLLSRMLRLVAQALSRSSIRATPTSRTMSSTAAPTFKPFNLALIQLGGVGADKAGACTSLRAHFHAMHTRSHGSSEPQTCARDDQKGCKRRWRREAQA